MTFAAPLLAQAVPSVYTLPPDKLVKALHLARIHNVIEFGSTIWMALFLILILKLRWVAALRDWAARRTERRWLQGFLFLPEFLLLVSFAPLPFEIWGHHTSLVYGLSVQRWPSWVWDWTKSLLITLLIGTLLLSGLFAIIRHWPRRWWLWCWLIALPLQVLAIFLVPYILDPLFNHFEPLTQSHPALVDQLERVVAKSDLQIPPSRIFLMKASEKVTGLNAYVTGFGASKRIVVWDTTIQKATPEEILFIFGHEQGHYVLNHIQKGLIFSSVLLLVGFFLAYRAAWWLVRRFGDERHIAAVEDWAALGALALVFVVLSFLADPIANAFSRVAEHHADIYGQEIIHGIVPNPEQTAASGFQVLGEVSLAEPDPNPLLVFWIYSHPSISRRLSFAARYNPWQAGSHPRYFPAAR